MYYVETMIDGILHYKTTPHGNWIPISIEVLSQRVVKAEKRVSLLKDQLQEAKSIPKLTSEALGQLFTGKSN